MRREHNWVYALVYGLLLVVPSLLLVASYHQLKQFERKVDLPVSPIIVTVQSQLYTNSFPVTVTPTWAEPVELSPPAWSGLVTALYVEPHQPIASGDRVLSIDSVDRLAFHSEQPFFRRLELRATGADVSQLQFMLAALHFYKGDATGTFATDTLAAVRAFAATIGVDDRVDGFDPAWIIWLPSSTFDVGSVGVRVGETAPVARSEWLLSQPRLTSLFIGRAADGGTASAPNAPGSLGALDSGEWKITLDGASTSFDWDTGRVPTEADLTRVAAVLPPSRSVSEATGIHAIASSPSDVVVMSVPVTAIVDSSTGPCVIITDPNRRYKPVAVRLKGIVSADGQSTFIEPTLSIVRIVANPADAFGGELDCNSN